ncbi:MAG TPA: C40 family peptidase [Gaiellaceae bacterium]|nr:C40 family peptidase [Gaiellaceae bacterium]
MAAAVAAVALPVAGAAASAHSSNAAATWALPQIRFDLSKGLFSESTVSTFRPTATLTRQTLSNLAFGLELAIAPPEVAPPGDSSGDGSGGSGWGDGSGWGTSTDPTTTDPAATDPTATDPTVTDPTATDPTATDPASTDPTATDPAATDPTATTPAPTPAPPPAKPPAVSNPAGAVTMTGLDSRLVSSLGLASAGLEFAHGAKAAGLKVPDRFGSEVVARLLGLRLDHPAAEDFLELRPQDPATRAEAAYSAAQILGFGWQGNGWEIAAVQQLADDFSLPTLTEWQKRILDVAFSKIGMPYVWGGTSDGPEAPFGIRAPGGYDCSGFVWRVYKLQSYPDEGSLASTLRGRTTYTMSVEVPRSELIPRAKLQPADVIFFGKGPNSSSSQIDHMGIYVGNGWFIHSSGYGVALARLDGWYAKSFAWGRRPLREAGLS